MLRSFFFIFLICTFYNAKGWCIVDYNDINQSISSKISQKFGYNNLIIQSDITKDVKNSQKIAILDITSVEDGKFTAKILVNGNSKELHGTYEEGIILPVLSKRINKGTIIGKNDLVIKIFPEKVLKRNILSDQRDIIGLVASKTLLPDTPLKINNLKKLIVIKKGSMVNLKFLKKNLTIEATGISMDNGAIGDLIKVKVANTNKIVNGIVKDNKSIMINE